MTGSPAGKSRVVLAMSGGVDSSVAAHLLVRDGFEVIGVFMRHGGPNEESTIHCSQSENDHPGTLLPVLSGGAGLAQKQGCCSALDAADARRVADDLDIPFYALNLQEDFDRIIDYFVDEYANGRTPNPCVMCNNWLKFGRLFDYADSVGADFVATGHYARLSRFAERTPALLRGKDEDKDQSYVLFGVNRGLLSRMMLPIGEYTKAEIRQLARQFGLAVAEKPDSQEICFVAAGKHADFVGDRRGEQEIEGQIVTTTGEVVGTHAGIHRFTVGQRKGLGVAMGRPYFVVNIDSESRNVVIGERHELARTEIKAIRVNWLVDQPRSSFRCQAQIRYNSKPQPATAFPQSGPALRVEFDHPCYGVAPGQAMVCYDGSRVIGGGWIV